MSKMSDNHFFRGFFFVAILVLLPVFVLARNNSFSSDIPPPPKNIPPENSQPDFILNPSSTDDENEEEDSVYPGTANCFDYYRFQSVQVNAATENEGYIAGEEVSFRGEVTNENKYPVVDGYVFVRVGPVNAAYRTEGHNITDEFFAVERMTLDVGVKAPISFKWRVPKNAPSGEYIANYFFSVGKRFNLGGLPFSNEIVIGSTNFIVEGENDSGLLFDRKGTKVNGERYFHIGNWPNIKPGTKVSIEQPIKNFSKLEKETKVTYELYYWDSLREEDKVASSKEEVKLLPGASKTLKYEIPSMDKSVYYLKVTANTENDQAIVNIRVASDEPRPRINYPAITKFPVMSGETFAAFSCFHNTSYVNAEGKVELTLMDISGNKVQEISYDGVIPPDMLAIAGDITAEKFYDYLLLRAEIWNANGTIIDSYEAVYDCNELKSPACEKTAPKELIWKLLLVIGLVVILILAIIGWRFFRTENTIIKQDY